MDGVKCTSVISCPKSVSRYGHVSCSSFIDKRCRWGTDQHQKFVAQLAVIPNLKIDYVVLNAGVLNYPNVSSDACRSS